MAGGVSISTHLERGTGEAESWRKFQLGVSGPQLSPLAPNTRDSVPSSRSSDIPVWSHADLKVGTPKGLRSRTDCWRSGQPYLHSVVAFTQQTHTNVGFSPRACALAPRRFADFLTNRSGYRHRARRTFGTPLAITTGVSTRHPDLSRAVAPACAFSSQVLLPMHSAGTHNLPS
jgi:hypothetical protein